jgi:teichuronic acid biosynthesis glycosyltransferase TuaH
VQNSLSPIVYAVRSHKPLASEHRRNLLLIELSKRRTVVFLSDARSKSMFPKISSRNGNLIVVDNALRLTYSKLYPLCPKLFSALDSFFLERALNQVGIRKFVPWITTAEPEVRDVFSRYRYVYDCIDPCFVPDHVEQHDAVESQLVRKAAVTFCTATALFDKCSRLSSHSYLINNAVDERYIKSLSVQTTRRDLLSDSTFIYLGTIDWRIDFDFLFRIANLGVRLVLAGRVNDSNKELTDKLASFKNVSVLGPVSDEEGIDLLNNASVALLPYTPGAMNDCINSLKMYLYLAAGLPILSTAIQESVQNDLVTTSNSEVSQHLIRELITSNREVGLVQTRRTFAEENTWRARSLQVDAVLQDYDI